MEPFGSTHPSPQQTEYWVHITADAAVIHLSISHSSFWGSTSFPNQRGHPTLSDLEVLIIISAVNCPSESCSHSVDKNKITWMVDGDGYLRPPNRGLVWFSPVGPSKKFCPWKLWTESVTKLSPVWVRVQLRTDLTCCSICTENELIIIDDVV